MKPVTVFLSPTLQAVAVAPLPAFESAVGRRDGGAALRASANNDHGLTHFGAVHRRIVEWCPRRECAGGKRPDAEIATGIGCFGRGIHRVIRSLESDLRTTGVADVRAAAIKCVASMGVARKLPHVASRFQAARP